MRIEGSELFSGRGLDAYLKATLQDALLEVESLNEKHIRNLPPKAISDQVVQKYKLNLLEAGKPKLDYERVRAVLHEDGSVVRSKGIARGQIDARRYLYGMRFKGRMDIFSMKPSKFGPSSPKGTIEGDSIIISVLVKEDSFNEDEIVEEFKRQEALVREYISYANEQISEYNKRLNVEAPEVAKERLRKLEQADRDFESLKDKLK